MTGPANSLPNGDPGVTSLRELRQDLLGFYRRGLRNYDRIVEFVIEGERFVLLNDPELIHKVLTSSFDDVTIGRSLRAVRPLVGNGILTNYTPSWRSRRILVQRPLSHRHVQEFGHLMVRQTLAHTAEWTDSSEIEIVRETTGLTLSIAAEALFSEDASVFERQIRSAMDDALRCFETAMSNTDPEAVDAEMRSIADRIDEVVYEIIARRRSGQTSANDLLGLLIDARDEDGKPLDDRALRDEAVTLILAGHETTGVTLGWALYLLYTHREWLGRLQEQIHAVIGMRSATVSDLETIPLARQVIEETLRLYPVVHALDRTAARDFELDGYLIPAGAELLFSALALHHDARLFRNPDHFDPDRFDSALRRDLPRYGYFPFGGGPKICAGNHFALLEGSLVVVTIAQNFDLEVLETSEPEVWPTSSLRPRHGIRAVTRRRSIHVERDEAS